MNFNFDGIKNCPIYIKANIQKNTSSTCSLMESVTCPYQVHFMNFGFSGCVSYDKDDKVLSSNCEHVEGLNGESGWILICDA